MIKIYVPNALMRAAADVVKAHPKEQSLHTLTEPELKELLDRIERCAPEQIPVLALSLLPKEVMALCGYLPHNRYRRQVAGIIQVISLNMQPRYYKELFDQWQKYPGNRNLLKLLGQHDNAQIHGADIRIPVGKFALWNASSRVYGDIVAYVRSVANVYDPFEDQFEAAGFRRNTPLQTECLTDYLTSCSMQGYVQVGDYTVAQCTKKAQLETAEMVLLNLLICGDKSRSLLKEFRNCYAVMLNLWREPYAGRFPKNQEKAQRVYYWLYNYIEMVNSFAADADYRRRDFWAQYLDRCEVTKIKKHRMLIFNFDGYCAVEFEVVGRIFIYDKGYFERNIRPRANSEQKTQELKNWMFNYTTYRFQDTHQGNWEFRVGPQVRRII